MRNSAACTFTGNERESDVNKLDDVARYAFGNVRNTPDGRMPASRSLPEGWNSEQSRRQIGMMHLVVQSGDIGFHVG